MTRNKVEALKSRGAELVRKITRTDDREEKTRALRELASVVVDLRSFFFDDEGNEDFRGRTWAYRQSVAEVFSRSNVSSEKVDALQASLRYHVSIVLRERLTPKELEQYGLKPESARDRNRAVRERTAETVRLLRVSEGMTGEEALRALAAAERLLSRLDSKALRSLDTKNRKAALTLLHAIESLSSEVAGEISPRSRR